MRDGVAGVLEGLAACHRDSRTVMRIVQTGLFEHEFSATE